MDKGADMYGKVLVTLLSMLSASSLLAAGNVLNAVKVSAPFTIDGDTVERAYVSAEWSRHFTVLEKESSEVNALYLAVDEKFVKTASRAAVFFDKGSLYLTVLSNFPKDCPPEQTESLEFHLQPNAGKVYCISVKMDGSVSAGVYENEPRNAKKRSIAGIKAKILRSKSGFTTELQVPFKCFGKDVKPEGTWRCNFIRRGGSCGGMSSWAPTNRELVAPERFGRLVFGGPVKENDNAEPIPENLEKKTFVWGGDMWGDVSQTAQPPLHVKELKSVTLNGYRGARAAASFRVSNLTDANVLYNLHFNSANTNFNSRLRLREVGYIQLRSKEMIADPVFDMPIGSVLRIPPRSTAVVWMDVDCTTFKPGRVRGEIRMVPGYAGFEEKKLEVTLNVGTPDLAELDMYVHYYYNLHAAGVAPLVKDYGFNVFTLLPHVHFSEKGYFKGQKGREICGFDKIDAMFARLEEAGLPKDRVRIMLYALWPKWALAGFELADIRSKKIKFLDPEWKRRYAIRLKAVVEYLRTRHGVGYDRLMLSTCDEPHGDFEDPTTTAYAAIKGAEFVKSVDPQLKVTCNPLKEDMSKLDLYFKNFDYLVPYIRRLTDGLDDRVKADRYRDSGRWISSYIIYVKQNSIHQYRRCQWANLDYGFDGPCAVYGLVTAAGDQFNSFDSSKKGGSTSDYNAGYRNSRTGQITPSRRLEAWYQGLVDFKLVKWCQLRIAERMAKGEDMSKVKAGLETLIREANAPRGDFEKTRTRLSAIAESLAKGK